MKTDKKSTLKSYKQDVYKQDRKLKPVHRGNEESD